MNSPRPAPGLLLPATAALAVLLSAGAAVAQVQGINLRGLARMGVQWAQVNGVSTVNLDHRLQLDLSVNVPADNGLAFGAYTRLRAAEGQAGIWSASRVWVQTRNLRLTFGNQDGAFRLAGAAYGYLGGCGIGYEYGQQCGDTAGLIGRTQGFTTVNPGPAQRVRLDFADRDTRVALSHDRAGSFGPLSGTEFGIRRRFDRVTLALGHANRSVIGGQYAAGASTALSGQYDTGRWAVGALVARLTNGAGPAAVSRTTWSLSGRAELGEGEVYAYAGRSVTPGFQPANAGGLTYRHFLGSGSSLIAGVERLGPRTTASVGVVFGF